LDRKTRRKAVWLLLLLLVTYSRVNAHDQDDEIVTEARWYDERQAVNCRVVLIRIIRMP
jgi:hypothetical protein